MLKYDTLRGIFFVFLCFMRCRTAVRHVSPLAYQLQVPASVELSDTTCSLVKSRVSSRLQRVRHVQLEIINLTLSSAQKLRLHLFQKVSPLQTADQEAKSQRIARLSAIHPIYLAIFSPRSVFWRTIEQTARCRLPFCAICFYFLTFSSVERRKVNDFNLLFTSADISSGLFRALIRMNTFSGCLASPEWPLHC